MAKKKVDKLAQDVSKAIAAGMSYGKWKAMQQPVKTENGIPEGWLVCQHCGKAFKPKTKRGQRFCDYYCQQQAYYEKQKEQALERKAKNG